MMTKQMSFSLLANVWIIIGMLNNILLEEKKNTSEGMYKFLIQQHTISAINSRILEEGSTPELVVCELQTMILSSIDNCIGKGLFWETFVKHYNT